MTQRCFVFEWICAGACEDEQFAQALIADGRAMLTAVASDIARLDNVSASTLSSIGPIASDVNTIPTTTSSWRQAYRDAVDAADVALVIAPEFALIDEQLVDASAKFANCTPDSIAFFSDKLSVCNTLQAAGVMTPFTVDAGPNCVDRIEGQSVDFTVLKPRDGVGEGFRRFQTKEDLIRAVADQQDEDTGRPMVAQTFADGVPRSIAAIVGPDAYEVWPSCEQLLTPLGESLVYGGGRINPHSEITVPAWLDHVLRAVPGLKGYVSIDYVETAEGPVFIELNPRISVSYIGYRAATDDNLADWLLGRATRQVRWNSGRWRWTKYGDIIRED